MSAQTVTNGDILDAFHALGQLQSLANNPRAKALADTIADALEIARVAVRGREEAVKTRRMRQAISRRLDADERDFRAAMARKHEEEELGMALMDERVMAAMWGDEYGAEA